MPYRVKEIYYSLQGEGARTGRPAVFLRFSGCNLWNGREEDRKTAVCTFCDTDFVGTDGPGGGRFETPDNLADAAWQYWPAYSRTDARPYVVCTGGEPLLQLDTPLINCLHDRDFEVAVETNGTISPPEGLDWVCVSPKANTDLVITGGQELKLVYPQQNIDPEAFVGFNFEHFFLQPKDGPHLEQHTRRVVDYCLKNPKWRVSLQTQKILNIP